MFNITIGFEDESTNSNLDSSDSNLDSSDLIPVTQKVLTLTINNSEDNSEDNIEVSLSLTVFF